MTFDYIIVGAGSAGCVLAERLSAGGRFSVLVLEAGGSDRRFYIHLPLGYGKTFYDPRLNWMYRAEPDPGLAGQADFWPRGKVLGGSSSINAMVYIRGHPNDYDGWAAAGNPGWGWNGVSRAFAAIEEGPLGIGDASPDQHPLCREFFASAARAGLPYNPDFNGATQEGVGYYRLTTKNGRRMSAARAFLRPAMKRKNLRVETRAHVTRILFDGARATGLEYVRNGETLTARAGREVIVAGGSVNSAQLLQLSGIGPADLLRRHGIDVHVDNENAGRHLQDHIGINYTWEMKVPTLNQVLRPWWGKLGAGARYVLTRRGPLALSINHAGGFFRTSQAYERPNMQLYMQAFSTLITRDGERPVLSPDPFPGLSLGLSSCRPTSRGEIMIRSADPFHPPRILANALSTEHDVQEFLDAVKFLRAIAAEPPLAGLMKEELRPGPSVRSDEELIADMRQRSGTVYHPASTCRMGPDPESSVVDPRLRVHGVTGLRVCDASIFPGLMAGNTNAAAMMVGWKGAEMILEDATR